MGRILHYLAADLGILRVCLTADGDVYHPIVLAPDCASGYYCDRWVCSFNYGDQVVLTAEDNPYGVEGLPHGTGTIIGCRRKEDRSVLVSSDMFNNGARSMSTSSAWRGSTACSRPSPWSGCRRWVTATEPT